MTIKQRDFFTHYVHVETPGKELCWNFYTKKKNVSFGLFRQTDNFNGKKATKLLVSTGNGVVSEMSAATSQTVPRASTTSISSTGEARQSAGKSKRVEPPGID